MRDEFDLEEPPCGHSDHCYPCGEIRPDPLEKVIEETKQAIRDIFDD